MKAKVNVHAIKTSAIYTYTHMFKCMRLVWGNMCCRQKQKSYRCRRPEAK